MDVDMHMDMEAKPTTAQSGTSSLAHPPPLSTISLTSLPSEIVLQVLSFLPLPILLAFRLVSTWTNTLVLEPVFWDRLEFSKQLLFKVGGGAGAQQSQHRRANLGLGGTEVGAGKESVFQHSSDANLIVHRQSLAATSPSPTSSWIEDTRAAAGLDAGGAGPSVTISANIPRSIQQQQQHQQDTLSTSPTSSTVIQRQPKHSPWTKIETSFLSFLTRLAHNPRTARGVRTIVLEDWEGAESVQVLWTTLSAFSKLQTLIVRNSVLRHLRFHQSNDYSIDKDDGATTWTKLLELNFQDCALALKKASFIHTKIQDEDLIALLRRSPELEELRLDQCYGLTVRALEAIAFGDQSPASFGDGVEGQGADAGGVLGVAGQAPMTTMMDQEVQTKGSGYSSGVET
ncbi:hypothetical protein KI688_000039 [Linnemannia hyalina]|uniref:F-box domain-containing protein n=1 Tax=Linnemannia hyalina TaxID=64524 RepID=A0A9P7Y3H3_9FUNG|nr:hypothetical protein KI688_000039 [Linnemannia hyalina]